MDASAYAGQYEVDAAAYGEQGDEKEEEEEEEGDDGMGRYEVTFPYAYTLLYTF